MDHSLQTTYEHLVSLTDKEARAFGQWLLNAYEAEDEKRRGHTSGVHASMTNEVFELVGDLANKLNGVD